MTPEPCLKGQCRSPVACGGFGYCRERNADGLPSERTAKEWRADANMRSKQHQERALTKTIGRAHR